MCVWIQYTAGDRKLATCVGREVGFGRETRQRDGHFALFGKFFPLRKRGFVEAVLRNVAVTRARQSLVDKRLGTRNEGSLGGCRRLVATCLVGGKVAENMVAQRADRWDLSL